MEFEKEIKEINRKISVLMIWIGICFFGLIVFGVALLKII